MSTYMYESDGLGTKLDNTYATKSTSWVGTAKLPTVDGTDLEKAARDKYKDDFQVEIINVRAEKDGKYAVSDYSHLPEETIDNKIKNLEGEAQHIREKYSYMSELSESDIILLRELTLAKILKKNFASQAKVRNLQIRDDARYQGKSGDKAVLRAGVDQGNMSFVDRIKNRAAASRANKNAKSNRYDEIDHSEDWRTNSGNSLALRRLNSKSKSVLLKVRDRMVANDHKFTKDEKFIKFGKNLDKYTVKKIVDATKSGEDSVMYKGYFTSADNKLLNYIDERLSQMGSKADETVWEFTNEDAYLNGELFTECVTDLVNVESEETFEESVMNDIQQLADLL